jgi:hypothetical protein
MYSILELSIAIWHLDQQVVNLISFKTIYRIAIFSLVEKVAAI